MVNNNPNVYATLLTVGSYPVDFFYPASFTTFPMISYFDSGHTSEDFADGQNQIDYVETTVDVWEKADPTTGVVTEIHQTVDTKMRAAGYIRQAFVNQFELDTKIYHYTFKYTKLESEV